MTRLRDGLFDKRRTINGLRVLIATQPNGTGLIRDNFAVRIKHPAGDIDLEMTASYYWQVYAAVEKMWPTIMQMKNKA
jgi:hypothetical protein